MENSKVAIIGRNSIVKKPINMINSHFSETVDDFSDSYLSDIISRRGIKFKDKSTRLALASVSYTHLTLPTTPYV